MEKEQPSIHSVKNEPFPWSTMISTSNSQVEHSHDERRFARDSYV